jgi:sulfate permease, SulP family
VDHVRGELMRRIEAREAPVSLVILDLSASPGIDLAGVRLLAQLASLLEARGMAFRLAEVRGTVRDMIGAEGLAERLGIGERGLSVAEITAGFAGRRTALAGR